MKKRSTSAKKKKRPAKNVDEIIKEADAAVEALDMNRALTLYTAASKLLQNDSVLLAKVLGKLGEVKVSLGNQEGARQDFTGAISLLSNEESSTVELHELRASLYLYLGQLSLEKEALEAYEKGVEELKACVLLREKACGSAQSDPSEQDALQETRRQLSAAYCSIAELYLTDLCYEQDAEQECEAAIQAAMKITDPVDGKPLVDSLQAMASLRLSQSRGQEATECILQAYSKMECGCVALAALVGLHKDDEASAQAVELVDVDAANNLPEFDFRCQTAKILLECNAALKECQGAAALEHAVQCSDACVQVLGSLLAENDEVVDIWYLTGCAFAAASPPDLDTAAQYWERALEMLIEVKEGLEMELRGGDEDDEARNQLQQVNSQIEEIQKNLTGLCGQEMDDMDTEDVQMKS